MALHLAKNLVSTADQELFIRRAEERGYSDQGWMKSYYTFSFADYYDLRFMGFRTLKVLNEDRVAPAEGFPPHPQKNMEILTYVISGGLAHKDSTEGAGIVNLVRPGELQRMSAGAGIRHSEFNASEHGGVHFLQIWIEPDTLDIAPSYEQKSFSKEDRVGKFKLIASRDGRENSVIVHQDMSLYCALLERESTLHWNVQPERYAWLQVVRGSVSLNGVSLHAGDGVAVFGGGPLDLKSNAAEPLIGSALDPHDGISELPEILLFDLA